MKRNTSLRDGLVILALCFLFVILVLFTCDRILMPSVLSIKMDGKLMKIKTVEAPDHEGLSSMVSDVVLVLSKKKPGSFEWNHTGFRPSAESLVRQLDAADYEYGQLQPRRVRKIYEYSIDTAAVEGLDDFIQDGYKVYLICFKALGNGDSPDSVLMVKDVTELIRTTRE